MAKLERRRGRKELREQEVDLQRHARAAARARKQAQQRRAHFAPLAQVLADADVVIMMLDARDPTASRCPSLEHALIECGKLPVLLLNKADLVPRAALSAWLAALQGEVAALPFSCGPAKAAGGDVYTDSPPGGGSLSLERLLISRRDEMTSNSLSPGTTPLQLTVGVVGFDSSGKRSLIRQMTSNAPERVKWLPLSAVLQPVSEHVPHLFALLFFTLVCLRR